MVHPRTALRSALRAAFRSTAPSHSSSSENLRFRVLTRTLEVPAPAASRARLRLRVEVREGVVRWELLDAARHPHASGTATPGETLDEVREGAACWTLRLTLEHATGTFSAGWEAP